MPKKEIFLTDQFKRYQAERMLVVPEDVTLEKVLAIARDFFLNVERTDHYQNHPKCGKPEFFVGNSFHFVAGEIANFLCQYGASVHKIFDVLIRATSMQPSNLHKDRFEPEEWEWDDVWVYFLQNIIEYEMFQQYSDLLEENQRREEITRTIW